MARWAGEGALEPVAAHADLETGLAAGETWNAALAVTAPHASGRRALRVELVEQGVGEIPHEGDDKVEVSTEA